MSSELVLAAIGDLARGRRHLASGKSTFQNTPGDFGGGFAGDVAEDGDAATLGLDDGAFFGGELIHGIIATLDVEVGLEFL